MVMRPPWLSGVMMVLGGDGVWDIALAQSSSSKCDGSGGEGERIKNERKMMMVDEIHLEIEIGG